MSTHSDKVLTTTTSLPGIGTTEVDLPCCIDFAVYPIGTTVPFSDLIDAIEEVLKKCGKTPLILY